MTKKIICMLLCFATIFSLTACGMFGGKEETPETPDTTEPIVDTQPDENNTQPTEESKPVVDVGDYREGSVEYVAIDFIKSLIAEDYETALRNFAVPAETPFFTVADVEWYLPRSNYADILDINYEEYAITAVAEKEEAEKATCEVTVQDKASDKSKTFNLTLTLDKYNKWGVKDNGFYLNEYYVVAPGGNAKLTVDGVNATDYQDSKFGTTQYQYVYKLTYVGKSEKTFAVSHANFDKDEEKVFPVANTLEEPMKLVVEYDKDAAADAMRAIWMECYQAAVDGKTYSDLVHLLSPSADPAMAQGIMNGLNDIIDGGNCHDFVITKIQYAAQKDGQHTKWLASDKLQISFNYSLSWVVDGFGGGQEDMNNWDVVILHYDGEKFTLDTLVNNHIFTERDAWNDESI